ncbi:MAG: hypothetical protein ACLP1X_23955 [Polyangiaceae bacterium]
MSPRAILGPVLALVVSGCHGCGDGHPYVPYAIETLEGGADVPGDAASAPAPSVPPTDGGRVPFSGEAAIVAPPGMARWPVGGITLDAPQGMVFVSAIVRDFDGDGTNDAFAIVRPPEANDPGVLAFYRGTGTVPSAPATFAPPATLARDASCSPIDRIVLAGGRSVLVELGSHCPEHPSSGAVRWIAVVNGAPTARVVLAATLADPPGAPALSVDADVSDHDGDGRDDVALRVSLEGGGPPLEPGPRVSAIFVWLDRSAGLSRDASATESSLAALGTAAAARAVRLSEAPAVPSYVAQARALWRAACADEGSPRLLAVAGTAAIACGAGRALEELGLAEVRAYTTMGDPLRAALALDRAERPPATRTASRAHEAEGWIAQLAPVAKARVVRQVAGVPMVARGREPSWGALAFEASGKLLVRTRAGVARVDPDQGDEAAATDVPEWKAAVTSPDGAMHWIETYDPCDGLPLRATFETASGDDVRDLALPVVPRLGGRCAGSRGAPARALAIAWGPGGLEAIVEEQPLLVAPDLTHASALATFLDQPATPGAPRSPDGKTYVVPTGAGLVVRGPGRARLLRGAELDGSYAEQHDCAVSNDATHVACVRAGKAWVGTWEAP